MVISGPLFVQTLRYYGYETWTTDSLKRGIAPKN